MRVRLGLVSFVLCWATFAGQALGQTVTFFPTGGPADVHGPRACRRLNVVAVGGSGGGVWQQSSRRFRRRVVRSLAVSPGQVLYVEVGGNGDLGLSSESSRRFQRRRQGWTGAGGVRWRIRCPDRAAGRVHIVGLPADRCRRRRRRDGARWRERGCGRRGHRRRRRRRDGDEATAPAALGSTTLPRQPQARSASAAPAELGPPGARAVAAASSAAAAAARRALRTPMYCDALTLGGNGGGGSSGFAAGASNTSVGTDTTGVRLGHDHLHRARPGPATGPALDRGHREVAAVAAGPIRQGGAPDVRAIREAATATPSRSARYSAGLWVTISWVEVQRTSASTATPRPGRC